MQRPINISKMVGQGTTEEKGKSSIVMNEAGLSLLVGDKFWF